MYPLNKVKGVEEIIDAMINLITRNLIAKTDLVVNAVAGDTVIYVKNSFQFKPDQEILILDETRETEGGTHYDQFEYAKIKSIDDTDQITLYEAVAGTWLVSDGSRIQKTIGHTPLFEQDVYYGDREVIPLENMAITVEPNGLSNEWKYIQGGLDEEYSLTITVYGKEIKYEDGARILHRYAHQTYQLINDNIHADIEYDYTQLVENVSSGATEVIISDTATNREVFAPYAPANNLYVYGFELQDNKNASRWYKITGRSIGGGLIRLTLDRALSHNYSIADFAIIKRNSRYFWDSRATGIEYGTINKGSAFIRAAQIKWVGHAINDHYFPQTTNNIENFEAIEANESSSSSSSSSDG